MHHSPATLASILLGNAERDAGALACLFREGQQDQRLSKGELAARAGGWARELRALGARGERVVLALPSGLGFVEAFFGVLLAGGAAVPASVPRPGRSFDRLLGILDDCRPVAVIAEAATLATLRDLRPGDTSMRWLDIATPPPPDARGEDHARPRGLALLQYTSGSVGRPKGVVIDHDNLVAQGRALAEGFELPPGAVLGGWLPIHHDMGLVGNLLLSVFVGGECWLMSPASFLMRPARWLQLVHDSRAIMSGAPNFAYDLCVTRIKEKDAEGLDLSEWTRAFNGAEPVRAETIARFADRFAPQGFRPECMLPCYGLAEATLMVSTKHPHTPQRVLDVAGEEVSRVGCGPPPREVEVLIVDPETLAPVAEGEAGEIWTAGPSVGRGYWPGRDAGVFNQAPAGSDDHRWMRTGDLGRLHGGDLFITGRLKAMVIVAGQNHHAEDIEQVALRALGPERSLCAAAFAVDGPEGERLVLAIECRVDDDERELLTGVVAGALSEALDLGASTIEFVPPGRLPRTTSGKVRRHECRELFLAREAPFTGVIR